MRHWIFILLIACCVVAGLSAFGPKQATADEYWDGYWSWYDGTYSPYYTRRYYATPSYSYAYPYSGSYYGPSYGYYPGDPYFYGRSRYYGDYYGTPNFGYRDYLGGGGQVRVGPMRFGWR